MQHEDIVVGLDIGTTKISVLVGRQTEFGKIDVLAKGMAESVGVMRGAVSNIDKTVTSIKEAVQKAQSQLKEDITISEVYVGIAGQHINSIQNRGVITRSEFDEEINQKDLDRLEEDMYKLVLPPGDKIINVLPQEFIVDNQPGHKDPVGMAGRRLEANFHIITGRVSDIRNIYRCVEKAGLIIKNLFLEPLASAASVLAEDEKEAGVVLVDIGGGTTDIAIFQDNIIRHTAVIPFGGNIITDDIKQGCNIMRRQAEALKVKFGSAISQETSENEVITVPGLKGRDPKEISNRFLAGIIQSRMEEILEIVNLEIRRSNYDENLIGGLVITGGGSQLKNLRQLVEYVTGQEAKIGYPSEHLIKGVVADIDHPMNATGIGLIIKGFEHQVQLKRRGMEFGAPEKTANKSHERNPDTGNRLPEKDTKKKEATKAAGEREMLVEAVERPSGERKKPLDQARGWLGNLIDYTGKMFMDEDDDFNVKK